MPAVSHLDILNAAQKKAVTYGEPTGDKGWAAGPLLVIAGAGTGKTSTIAHRVAQLVVHGVDPARLLLLTFTRRAAGEMRRRAHDIVREALNDTLGNKAQAMLQRLVWAGTFHSIGNRLLRHYARQLKLDPSFTVVDFLARTPVLRSIPGASIPRRACATRSNSSSPGARTGRRISPACFAAMSSASSAMRCWTTTICCSIGT
jgi:hypothetical protein